MADKVEFQHLLQGLECGYGGKIHTLAQAFEEALEEAVRTVHRSGGTATLTFKLKAKLKSPGEVELTPTISAKLPELSAASSRFYTDRGGTLVDKEPVQPKLPFRTVGDEQHEEAAS